jgi:uncharacterized protein (DUF1499 family)
MTDHPILAPCPDSPNCVSTEARDPAKRMDPIPCTGPPERVVDRLVEIVERMPGGRVVRREGAHVKAEFTSSLFRFVDDVDLVVDGEAGVIRFRSASRTGYWDLGANRKRMERLGRELAGER